MTPSDLGITLVDAICVGLLIGLAIGAATDRLRRRRNRRVALINPGDVLVMPGGEERVVKSVKGRTIIEVEPS